MADFHFLRPEWLWALVPLALVIWLAHRSKSQSQWQTWVANHLTPALLGQQQSQPVIFKTWFLSILWLITAVALAGPTWEKIEKPLFKSDRASVIVMDMSMSMRSTDVSPDRLTKSRFKAIDLATELGEGEVGLVAYAGDAFTISPLTQDPRNIASLIPSLSPEIMPVPGSYPLLGLLQAEQLMKQAGYLEGQIYWITDGVDLEDLDELREFASQTPFNISVLAVGTPMGAPIKLVDGSLLKDKGNIVIPKLNVDALADISAISGGETITWTADNKDILSLAALGSTKLNQKNESSFNSNQSNTANQGANDQQNGSALTGDDWHEAGPWLVLLIMPLLLYVFRKGVSRNMLSLTLVGITTVSITTTAFVSPQALAFNDENSTIERVFKTGDQRGYEAYSNGNYDAAQQRFVHDQWKATAAYKNKDYEQALSLFSNDTSALGYYNQGNALAHLGELDKAVDAYNKALELDESLDKAIENRKIIEQLKQQQEQQNAENQSNSDESKNDNQGDQNQSGSNQGEQNSEQSSGQESDQQQNQNANQEQNGQNQNANNEPSSSAQQNQESSQNQQDNPNNSNNSSNSEKEEQTSQQNSQQAGQSQPSEGQLDEQQANSEQTGNANMTPEQVAEKEKQQRIEQLLRKVDDNPSVLLRNKMILENKRRQYERRYPKGVEKTW